jgi:hypothetical protein
MPVFPTTSCLLLILLCIFAHQALRFVGRPRIGDVSFLHLLFFSFSIPQFRRPSSPSESSAGEEGKIWVVIVAGSKHWWDYEIHVILVEGGEWKTM